MRVIGRKSAYLASQWVTGISCMLYMCIKEGKGCHSFSNTGLFCYKCIYYKVFLSVLEK